MASRNWSRLSLPTVVAREGGLVIFNPGVAIAEDIFTRGRKQEFIRSTGSGGYTVAIITGVRYRTKAARMTNSTMQFIEVLGLYKIA